MKKPEPIKLLSFGPWKEITKAEAMAESPAHVLTVVEGGDDCDGWFAQSGFHYVNALMYFRSTKPLPTDLNVEDVWLDENNSPVTGEE